MSKFRKRPVEIEARLFASFDDIEPIREWSAGAVVPHEGDPVPQRASILMVDTLEGRMIAKLGDWIIKGVAGEFYPCKPDIFTATYEAAD